MLTTPADLLAIWEHGLAYPGPGRALALHRAARPDAGADDLLATPVGEREADLYALRRALFGDTMQVVTECAACAEVMEFDLDAAALAARAGADGESGAATGSARPDEPDEPDGTLRVTDGGWDVEFRLPTVADLAAAAAEPRPRRALVARLAFTATRDGRPVTADELPETLLHRLAEMAERADPAADVTLRVACPDCGAATRAELDIASYLWTELDSWARDLLVDVHLLATAYGWSEPEILALSPLRRRYYLELCADA